MLRFRNWWFMRFGLEVVQIIHGTPNEIELFVRSVCGVSGQHVDWFYGGGIAIVKVVGDKDRAMAAVRVLRHRFALQLN